MTPASYEDLITDICAQFAKDTDATVTRGRSFRGQSGQKHEVDVSVEFAVGGVKILMLIECKNWNKSVGADQVMVLLQRVRDIGAHKGVLVTTKGFQDGAYKQALANGIALIQCKGRRARRTIVLQRLRSTRSAHGPSIMMMEALAEHYEERYHYTRVFNDRREMATAFPIIMVQEAIIAHRLTPG